MNVKLIIVFVALSSFLLHGEDCGLKGTLEERIRDCNSGSSRSVLVFKKNTKKIIMDMKTKKLWSAPFSKSLNFYDGITKCQLAFNNLKGLRDLYEWRMSKTYELYNAFSHGIYQQLSREFKNYWGLPGRKFWMHKAYVFETIEHKPYSTGSYIKIGHDTGREHYLKRNVLCVGVPVRQ